VQWTMILYLILQLRFSPTVTISVRVSYFGKIYVTIKHTTSKRTIYVISSM